jgi:hypothetical protein
MVREYVKWDYGLRNAEQLETVVDRAIVRLHSAIGYITPASKLAGQEKVIFAERDRKLEQARERRRIARAAAWSAI